MQLADTAPDVREQAQTRSYDVIRVQSGATGYARRMAIMRDVAVRHGVTVEAILGNRRYPELVTARYAAMRAVAAAFPQDSLPMLGRLFNRDHTVVMRALRMEPKQ